MQSATSQRKFKIANFVAKYPGAEPKSNEFRKRKADIAAAAEGKKKRKLEKMYQADADPDHDASTISVLTALKDELAALKGSQDESKWTGVIGKLAAVDVNLHTLSASGIGKALNKLIKTMPGPAADDAKALVTKWKGVAEAVLGRAKKAKK